MTVPGVSNPSFIVAFATGSIGAGIYSTVPSVMLLYYMTEVLILPVGLASLAVLLPKLAIMVMEPMVGVWSDRTRSAWGRRTPFLLAGSLLSALTFVWLFNAPALDSVGLTLGLIGLSYLAASLAYSLFAVPYVAMSAEIAEGPAAQSRLISLRMAFVFVGVLIGAVAPPMIIEAFGGGTRAYGLMAVAIAGVSLASMLVTLAAASGTRNLSQPVGEPRMTKGGLLWLVRYRPFIIALLSYSMIMVGFGAISAAAPYYVVFGLGRAAGDLSALLGVQICAAMLSLAGWGWATPRLGFTRALVSSLACALLGAGAMLTVASDQAFEWVLGAAALLGAGTGGVQVGAFGLLAEVTGRASLESGVRREGLMTGLWTASEKVALALGPALTGAVLGLGGFLSATERALQPESALHAVRFAMGAAPAVPFILAAALLIAQRRALDSPRVQWRIDPL